MLVGINRQRGKSDWAPARRLAVQRCRMGAAGNWQWTRLMKVNEGSPIASASLAEPRETRHLAMFLWVLCLLASIFIIGLCLKLRRSSYFDSSAFQQAHWEEAHEREKVTQQRQL